MLLLVGNLSICVPLHSIIIIVVVVIIIITIIIIASALVQLITATIDN